MDIKNYAAFSLIKAAFLCFLDNQFNIGDAHSNSGLNINICANANFYKGLSLYTDIV